LEEIDCLATKGRANASRPKESDKCLQQPKGAHMPLNLSTESEGEYMQRPKGLDIAFQTNRELRRELGGGKESMIEVTLTHEA
jgi:hypothetical protein